MSQTPITIYVGAGNLDAPHYRFFLDEDRSNELANSTLDASYAYTFKRLAEAASHPFYLRENGSEEALSDQVIINGDGELINGITGDQSFMLSFADPSIAEENPERAALVSGVSRPQAVGIKLNAAAGECVAYPGCPQPHYFCRMMHESKPHY